MPDVRVFHIGRCPDQVFFVVFGVTTKILGSRLTLKLGNYRGSDVRGDKQFKIHLQND